MKELPLTQGKVALVDDADWDLVSAFKWWARQEKRRPHCWYATRKNAGKTIYLHRFIAGAAVGVDVDHKDGDGLNCQRDNIRIASRSQNNMNREVKGSPNQTGHHGIEVRYQKRKPYVARLRVNKRVIRSRSYFTLEEALAARRDLVAQHFPGFATE